MLSEQEQVAIAKRIRKAKTDLMTESPFFAVLLSYMKFSIDEHCKTAYTDGQRIAFSPAFMGELNDRELMFILCHEVMHVALRHLSRPGAEFKDSFIWNLATDTVVNSNIAASFGIDFINLRKYGISMHLAPDGKEGHRYSAEEVYDMLIEKAIHIKAAIGNSNSEGDLRGGPGNGKKDKSGNNGELSGGLSEGLEESLSGGKGRGFDNHDHWQDNESDESEDELWRERIFQASKIYEGVNRIAGSGKGFPPIFERMVKELEDPQIDWRTLLNNFIQEEVCDYSFNPPDRRFCGDFILPDYNDKCDKIKNVLFMVDTSGSIDVRMLTEAYSEIKGAIDQFDGNLEGYLGFFDHSVVPAVPFSSVKELTDIKPVGGGGTCFDIIFRYVNGEFVKQHGEPPASIIILTDGWADYPPESVTNGIPVLWLINDSRATPPWGVIARIEK